MTAALGETLATGDTVRPQVSVSHPQPFFAFVLVATTVSGFWLGVRRGRSVVEGTRWGFRKLRSVLDGVALAALVITLIVWMGHHPRFEWLGGGLAAVILGVLAFALGLV